MKRSIAAILTVMLIFLTGCGAELSPEAEKLQGRWSYNHDEVTPILTLKANGKAVFHGKNYTYNCDVEFIDLTDSEGEVLRLRYRADGDELYLYEHTTYIYDGEKAPDGVLGIWKTEDGKWSFEFTENGTFKEDGYFPGYYSVDEANGTFKLIYNDQFEDTTVYYNIDGNELRIEYPWPMVPTVK